MGLVGESSGVYWEQGGDDKDLEELMGLEEARYRNVPKREGEGAKEVDRLEDIHTGSILLKKIAMESSSLHNTSQDSEEKDGQDGLDQDNDEYTFNADIALQDAQAESHHAYQKGQAFYDPVGFDDFARYMQAKRRKLGVQQGAARRNADEDDKSELLKGLRIHVR